MVTILLEKGLLGHVLIAAAVQTSAHVQTGWAVPLTPKPDQTASVHACVNDHHDFSDIRISMLSIWAVVLGSRQASLNGGP